MGSKIWENLTEQQKREVRMYGVTVEGMREAIERSSTFKFSGPAMVAAGMMSDAQEMLAHDNGGQYDMMIIEDIRQLLNRAKWVLFTYAKEEA